MTRFSMEVQTTSQEAHVSASFPARSQEAADLIAQEFVAWAGSRVLSDEFKAAARREARGGEEPEPPQVEPPQVEPPQVEPPQVEPAEPEPTGGIEGLRAYKLARRGVPWQVLQTALWPDNPIRDIVSAACGYAEAGHLPPSNPLSISEFYERCQVAGGPPTHNYEPAALVWRARAAGLSWPEAARYSGHYTTAAAASPGLSAALVKHGWKALDEPINLRVGG